MIVNFGRGKDKQPRKRKILTTLGTGLLGAGSIGYLGSKDAEINYLLKKQLKTASPSMISRLKIDKDFNIAVRDKLKQDINIARLRKPGSIIKGNNSLIDKISKRNPKKAVELLNKIKRGAVIKSGLLGLTAGTVLGLTANSIYDKYGSKKK